MNQEQPRRFPRVEWSIHIDERNLPRRQCEHCGYTIIEGRMLQFIKEGKNARDRGKV